MQSTPTISVVMPVGNAREWLAAAVESIRGQSFLDWELIMVLDAPEDGSAAVAERMVEQDDRLTIIALPARGGAGHARNAGVRAARGEYVVFADADDLVPTGAYDTLVATARRTGSEIVSGGATQFDTDGGTRTYWTVDDAFRTESRAASKVEDVPELAHDHTPWNKLIRREWLVERGIEFPTSTTCEDVVWWARTVVDARVDTVPEVVYQHRRHERSVTARIGRGHELLDWTTQTEAAISHYRDAGLERSVTAVGKRLLLREAWTRVRSVSVFDADGRRELERFVRWLVTLLPSAEFEALSPYPRTCYRLLATEHADLVSAVVASFDRPGPRTVELWGESVAEIADVLGAMPAELSADLWRERLFSPTLGAAQRREAPETSPHVVTSFWDRYVAGNRTAALDQGEGRALEALRAGNLDDVGRVRRLRRAHAVARTSEAGWEVVLEGCPDLVTARVFAPTPTGRRLVATGDLGAGVGIVLSGRPRARGAVVEVPLATGEPLRFPVEFAAAGLARVLVAARRLGRTARR